MRAFKPVSDVAAQPLIALWHDVFGDPPELAEAFLRKLPQLGFGWAACDDGQVLGAAYGVDALELAGGKCLYLYAVAVRPEARGRGLGAALSRAVFDTGKARGAVYRCTEPAEPSLFGWYRRILGVDCVLCRKETVVYSIGGQAVRPIAPEAYAARREALLADKAHIRYAPAALGFEAVNCRVFGGGLYAVGEGIAAASIEDGATLVR